MASMRSFTEQRGCGRLHGVNRVGLAVALGRSLSICCQCGGRAGVHLSSAVVDFCRAVHANPSSARAGSLAWKDRVLDVISYEEKIG